MVPIKQNLLSTSKYNLKVPSESCAKDMKYIVVHNTGNNAAAANEVSYMINNNYSTSFNVAIDNKEIVIGIPVDRGAFAAGTRDGNAHGIHIEICYSKNDADLEKFKQAEQNAAEYIAFLLQERGWDISHVKKHQDFDGKYCPHRTLNLGWQRFLDMITAYMIPVDTGSAPNSKEYGFTARVTAQSGLNVRSGPSERYRIIKSLRYGTEVIVYKTQGNWGDIGYGWVSLQWLKKISVYIPPEEKVFKPYTFRIRCDVLNIRSGPSTDFPIQGQIVDKLRYTIVEEKDGKGSDRGWGRLKAGGWISLDWIMPG